MRRRALRAQIQNNVVALQEVTLFKKVSLLYFVLFFTLKIIRTMKKILFVNALLWAAILPTFSQTVWNRIPLTGSGAKIITVVREPRFNVRLTGTFPMGDISPQNIQSAALQNAAYAPETLGQLFEKLGGEFFLGSPSGQNQQSIEMSGQMRALPGVGLGIRLGRRFEFRAGLEQFRSEWSGQFPVIVFPHEQGQPVPPKTLQGSIHASASGVLINLETAFFITGGSIRPYLSGGIRGQFPMNMDSGAEIAGVSLPLEIEPVETSFSPFAAAGVQWNFWKNAFLDAGCSFGQWPGGDYGPAAEAGIGWRF